MKEAPELQMEMDGDGHEKLIGWGYSVRTSSDACITAINSYHYQVLSYGRDRRIILRASKEDPDCVLANVLASYFLYSTDASLASSHLASAKARLEHATSYEKSVYEAVAYLMAENRDDYAALNLHSKLLKEFPRDLVSLKRAQILCFYLGRPDLCLKFVEQLCHVFQYDCHFKEAVEFMEAWSPSWNSCSSFMYTHNWWHVAVCYLEGHSPINKVLEVYDHHIWKELQRSDADCGEVYANALGLLLRIDIRGKVSCIDDRLKTLASSVMDQSTWHKEWLLDLLAVWVLATSKETSKAEDLLKSMKSRIYSMSKKKQQLMQRGILLAEALYEYGKGNYEQAYELLGQNFAANDCKMIGASDEQLDVFNEVWYIILLNTGRASEAIEEIEKQIKKREGIPFLWRLLERGYSMAGMVDASVAAEKAKALETAYFKQMD